MKTLKCFLVLGIFVIQSIILYSQSYLLETKITGLSIPTCFDFLPDGNVIINQKNGLVKIYSLSNVLISNFWSFSDSIYFNGEMGLIGHCLDPAYNSNHYIYFYFIHTGGNYKIVRLTNVNNAGTSPVIIFNEPAVAGTVHVAGNLHFRYNKLYVSIGDNGTSSNAQSLTTFKGKILRINPDGTIPTDNPFYDDGNPHIGNDDRIWALGLRNSYDFAFSPFNDSLYATENMGGSPDEVNYIIKGKNYGWPVCQGFCSPYNPLYKQPLDTIRGSGGFNYAPTGILIYNGTVMPELNGKLIYCGYGLGPVQGIIKAELGNAPYYDTVLSHSIIEPTTSLICMKKGPDDYIYVSTYSGLIRKLVYNTSGIDPLNYPVKFSLSQNYPNPFNPVTSIKYSVPYQSSVNITIFDMLGREIKTLVNETKTAGDYEVTWNAESYPSGVYFYKFITSEYTEQKKMVLMK